MNCRKRERERRAAGSQSCTVDVFWFADCVVIIKDEGVYVTKNEKISEWRCDVTWFIHNVTYCDVRLLPAARELQTSRHRTEKRNAILCLRSEKGRNKEIKERSRGTVNKKEVKRVSTGKQRNTYGTHLTLRWLMSYIYGAPIPDVSRSHTTTQHSR
jgi:hypothetical protein